MAEHIVNLKGILYPGCFVGLLLGAIVDAHNIKTARDFYGFEASKHI